MEHRSAVAESRAGVRWLAFAALFLPLMFGLWWLVEETNREGQHDAELLPLFALIPLGIGVYHLVRARLHRV